MTDRDFFKACASHDWYYEMSDDPSARTRGSQARRRLQEAAALDPHHADILSAWMLHMFTGKAWGTTKADRPEEIHWVRPEPRDGRILPGQMTLDECLRAN